MPKKKRIEYVGHLRFGGQHYDLGSIPDNETAMKDAASIMPLIRIAAVLLTDDDKGMTKKIRESGDVNVWVRLLEQLLAAAEHKKREYDLLNAGYIRLQIALERVVGKRKMEATFAK
jgi:hypothetical protein